VQTRIHEPLINPFARSSLGAASWLEVVRSKCGNEPKSLEKVVRILCDYYGLYPDVDTTTADGEGEGEGGTPTVKEAQDGNVEIHQKHWKSGERAEQGGGVDDRRV